MLVLELVLVLMGTGLSEVVVESECLVVVELVVPGDVCGVVVHGLVVVLVVGCVGKGGVVVALVVGCVGKGGVVQVG